MPQPPKPSDGWDAEDLMPPARKGGRPTDLPSSIVRPASSASFPDGVKEITDRTPAPSPGVEPTVSIPQPLPPRPSIPSGGRASRGDAEEIVRLVTTASMKLRRGQTIEARKDLEAVIAQYPQAAAAYEALGDIDLAEMRFANAANRFMAALECEPGRPTAEMKLARATLRQSETVRQASMGVAYVGDDGDSRELIPVVLSLVLPGLGQIKKGDYVKGGVLLGVTLLCFLGVFLSPDVRNVTDHLKVDMASVAGRSSVAPTAPSITPVFVISIVGIIAAYCISVFDAIRSRSPKVDVDDARLIDR